ncbi:MAG: peptidase M48 Ste24p, partial [Nitrospirae bacterium]
LYGCAVNPVTGERELSFLSREEEIEIDRKYAPRQFSNDFGTVQDRELNDYVNSVGLKLAKKSHRPNMPYSFRVTNAHYMNAYAFPGGSIAVTRYLVANLENEEELAAVLGHEIGHVNARHTAALMTKATLLQGLLNIGSIALGTALGQDYPTLVRTFPLLGSIGGKLYLASYSRDNERQADELGQLYMARAGYDPMGMADTMLILQKEHEREPSALEILFSTHPMTEERYIKAKERAEILYRSYRNRPDYRERFLEHTKRVRALLPLMKSLINGDKAARQKKLKEAEAYYLKAISYKEDDYAANCRIGEFYIATGRSRKAIPYLERARRIYPQEPRSAKALATAYAMEKRWYRALENYTIADRLLPGDPEMLFLKGRCYEGMGRRREAAIYYSKFLKTGQRGEMAKYAYDRLVEWGY